MEEIVYLKQENEDPISDAFNLTIGTNDSNVFSGSTTSDGGMNFDMGLPIQGEVIQEEDTKQKRKRKTKDDGVQYPAEKQTKSKKSAETFDRFKEPLEIQRSVIAQMDNLSGIIENQLANVSSTKFSSGGKGKSLDIASLSEALSKVINVKSSAAKEISAMIKTALDYDYKKSKDDKTNDNDDIRSMMALYKAMAETPRNQSPDLYKQYASGAMALTYNTVNNDIAYDDMIQQNVDNGYQQYISNMSPEQRVIQAEGNPNIKEVVVEEAASGDAYFAWIDTTTNTFVDGMTQKPSSYLRDPDTRFDRQNGKVHIGLFGESYDLVIIQ